MKYRVTHKTLYSYNAPVSLCHNEAHLAPRSSLYQTCSKSKLSVKPTPAVQYEHVDYFGNSVSYFAIQSPHKVLTVTAVSEIDINQQPFELETARNSPPWETVRDLLQDRQILQAATIEAREYLLDSPFVTVHHLLKAFAEVSFFPNRPILEACLDLMHRVFTEFKYDPNFTTIVTPILEVLEHKRGVCQDFAHLMIGCLRSLGLAARYVSGYLETLPPPGQVKLQGSDASHAWLAVYVPELGWIDFDPTNDQIPINQHITTAWGRDYSDVTPLKGVIFGGGDHMLTVAVDVEKIEA
ncbi:transglutaminase family protein [Beggiatoa leptomitoformis]|uniref:Transglutaminase family protein n=1 Tax=Beggiatoa leptomitoformis TaxID=288004 RepID=A0A2N9YFZ1_9GAMM|nr:transglutaminase family protein [Beggiatoa leptomitoformis]ALG68268.1 transglutaminase family protein [Beggiatoa leptomitoformis]AUI69422.1 transglutaminase family protein [Beggiatoa leptomitoformis]